MKRKDFLSSVLASGTLLSGLPALAAAAGEESADSKKPVIPPYLKPGDTIGITCPAGFIMLKDIEPAMEQMKSWGFNIKVGNTVGKRDFTFGGNDADRAADFQQMLNDPAVKAIMCARGGYGFVRIVDHLVLL